MCDCTAEEHKSIPDIHFSIDGVEYRINRDQWFERAPEYDKCVIKLMHGPHKPYWILGLNFFTNYYTVFDYKNKQIGFAESINLDEPPNKGFINWCLSSAGLIGKQELDSVDEPKKQKKHHKSHHHSKKNYHTEEDEDEDLLQSNSNNMVVGHNQLAS